MAIRRKVSIFIGMMQNMLGSLAAVFAYVLYYNFFNVQAVLNVPKTDVLLYMFLLLAFGTLSIISGLFLVNEQ